MDSSLPKARRFLDAHKELILTLFVLVLEAVSVVLDQIGKNKVDILLVAFLLSAFGFAITLYSIFVARPDQISMDQKQLKVVEFVFSVIQLIAAFIQYLLTVLQVKIDYNASVVIVASALSPAFGIISVVFIFIKGRKSTDLSPTLPTTNSPTLELTTVRRPGSTLHEESESSKTDAPVESNVQTMTSIPTEPDEIGTSTDQVDPARSSIVRRHTDVGKQINTIIFAKHLTRADINASLAIPTSALQHIEIPEGENRVHLMAGDSAGEQWRFQLHTRLDGRPHPVFTSGWLQFVRNKGLQIGDEVIFRTMQEDEAGGAAQFMILVNRTS